jgi:hypothetical protein
MSILARAGVAGLQNPPEGSRIVQTSGAPATGSVCDTRAAALTPRGRSARSEPRL